MSTVGNYRGPNIVKDGLVLYVDAGSPNSYNDKISNTIWKNISGNNLTGSLFGPTFNSNNGGELIFDGVNDYANFGTDSSTMLTTSGSLSVWAKIPVYPSLYPALAGRGGSAGFDNNGYSIWYYQGQGVYASIANRTPIEHSSVSLVLGTSSSLGTTIHNYVMTWDNTSLSGYLDGVLIGNAPYIYGAGDTTSNSFLIGRGPSLWYISQSMYNTLLYNRKLSTAEVLQNYNAIKGRFGL